MKKLLSLFSFLLLHTAFFTSSSFAQCTCSNIGPQLVINGDFSAGNTGFSSGYNYSSGAGSGNYGIAANSGSATIWWPSCFDHTTGNGTGNLMWVDASSSTAGVLIWGQTISVNPGTDYVFSYWFENVSSSPPGSIQLAINGVDIGSAQIAPGTCQWVQYCVTWNSGSSTSAALSIRSNSTIGIGNDLGFDDISFRACQTLNVTTTQTNILCNGQCTGAGIVTPVNGTAPYTYSWNTLPVQTNDTAVGLCVGNYTVTVIDATLATTTATVAITEPAALTASVTSTAATCGNNNGTATATAGGGTPGYTYSWNTVPVQTTGTAIGLAGGNYSVTVADANGCTGTQTVVIAQPAAILLTATITPTICSASIGTATVYASGGTAPYTYSWSNGQTTATATGLAAVTYTAAVTDNNGCTQTQMATVTSNSPLIVNTTFTPAGCTVNNGTATAFPSNGTAPYTYQWSNGQTTQTAAGLAAVIYTVAVTDANGCIRTQTVIITQTPGPTATVTATPSSIAAGDSTILTSAGGVTYQWTPSTGLSCTNCANPVAAPSATTNYCVVVTDGNGCTDSACLTVSIIEPSCGALYIPNVFAPPNAFTPNNDKENEKLCVYGNCIEKIKLVIYNRWGEKVFETTDLTRCWDGTYRGKLLNTAVFVYYMEATLTNGEKITKKGNVSLIK